MPSVAPLLPMRLFAPHEISVSCVMLVHGANDFFFVWTGFVWLFIFSRVSRWLMKPHKFFTSRVYHEARRVYRVVFHVCLEFLTVVLHSGASQFC